MEDDDEVPPASKWCRGVSLIMRAHPKEVDESKEELAFTCCRGYHV